ncbi:MAG: methyltransferase domain-containing protein [Elusimicrobia bacterium]|nr:methyltransferase domain-containing protein [Elusimicrobiota bacterium]
MPTGESRDWRDPRFVAHYNALYALAAEAARPYLARLALKPEDRLVDFGCGDGSFLALAAPLVGEAVGVDGSPRQIELARLRLEGFPNAKLVRSGFLEFAPRGRTFTKAFSRKALHHLTDPDKEAFLRKSTDWLSPGALFLIEDGMFDFERRDLEENMPRVMEQARAHFGAAWEAKAGDFLHSLREEFPTGQDFWARALAAAGFRVLERWQKTCFLGGLLALREGR